MSYYNAHDLENFLGTYSSDVTIYTYPDKLLGSGIDHMQMLFAPMFEAGNVHVEIQHQLVSDSYVINEEMVTYDGKDTRYVSIYEVKQGKIQSVRFVRDE
jgi:hypothetical protein